MENASQSENASFDAHYEVRGSAIRIIVPGGHYWYNRVDTLQALLEGRIVKEGKVQRDLRACYGGAGVD